MNASFQMKFILALVAAFAAIGIAVAEREPDLRIYKSFYRGEDVGASITDEQTREGNVGQRSFPAVTSTGGQGTFLGMPQGQGSSSGASPKGTTGTAFGSRVGGSGFFPGRRTKTVTASGEDADEDEEANDVIPRRGVAG